MRAVESQDPDRHLIGLDACRKGRDRIKEKVYDKMKEFDFSPEEAVSSCVGHDPVHLSVP